MSEDFFDSLLAAVADALGETDRFARPTTSAQEGPSPFASIVTTFGDKAITFEVPQGRGIQGIRAADPDFDLGAFLVRVGEMFGAYHTAFDRGDLAPARRFVDEDVYGELATAADRSRPPTRRPPRVEDPRHQADDGEARWWPRPCSRPHQRRADR